MNAPPMKTSPLSAALSCNKISTGKVLLAVICISLSTMMMVHQVCAMQLGEQSDSIRSSSSSPSATVALIENPEFTVRVLENLLRSILYSTSPAELQPITNGAQKRGLDLGISRGFSGSQAGKHLMGLSAASFANGPGR